jgi:homoserine dehydrogenase
VPVDHCTIHPTAPPAAAALRIGLLGLGQVGAAVAARLRGAATDAERPIAIASALVRNPDARQRPPDVRIVTDAADVFASRPDVLVELLGGIEPARTLMLEGIARRIPIVTANKSLLAHCGDELLSAARTAGVPLLCEASVIAGLPFLAPLSSRRTFASSITSLTGIVNGTSNFILTRMSAGASYETALDEARARGFAEPDPTNDVQGIDALEKLVVLVRQLVPASIDPAAIEVDGIATLTARDLRRARDLGGTIKPVVHATWGNGALEAFAAPAFIPLANPLARFDGVTNGVTLRDRSGQTAIFAGPGAGPNVTAATILDDVWDAVHRGSPAPLAVTRRRVIAPTTAWLVTIEASTSLPPSEQIAERLGTHGVWIERTVRGSADGLEVVSLLTYRCASERIEVAARAVERAAGWRVSALRVLGGES